ncbi:MAG: NAD(+)/NADH kinase [Salinibacterium sp.]|nr:NAD(+)/NADH kinase [Salinibacterium sp.]
MAERHFLVVSHTGREETLNAAVTVCRRLIADGVVPVIPEADQADLLAHDAGLNVRILGADVSHTQLELVIVLGGDGTILRAAELARESNAPLLGINLGHVGFLAEAEREDLEETVARALARDYHVEERMTLAVRVKVEGEVVYETWALNETVLEKARTGHMARLDVAINGAFFTTYAADALIVATPTGSTAYSFSARGPIVSPRHRCLLLTPVSPHMLFDRALVLDSAEEVRITVTGPFGAAMTVDGRELGHLDPGDVVTATAASKPARVVSFVPRDFHQILKAKFGLSDR